MVPLRLSRGVDRDARHDGGCHRGLRGARLLPPGPPPTRAVRAGLRGQHGGELPDPPLAAGVRRRVRLGPGPRDHLRRAGAALHGEWCLRGARAHALPGPDQPALCLRPGWRRARLPRRDRAVERPRWADRGVRRRPRRRRLRPRLRLPRRRGGPSQERGSPHRRLRGLRGGPQLASAPGLAAARPRLGEGGTRWDPRGARPPVRRLEFALAGPGLGGSRGDVRSVRLELQPAYAGRLSGPTAPPRHRRQRVYGPHGLRRLPRAEGLPALRHHEPAPSSSPRCRRPGHRNRRWARRALCAGVRAGQRPPPSR